jgi:hypothetical protein
MSQKGECMFNNYKIVKKSRLDELKDDVWQDYYKRLGLLDAYQLGQISIVESLVNYIDKEYCTIILKDIKGYKDTSGKIKEVVAELLDKYNKEPKFEL